MKIDTKQRQSVDQNLRKLAEISVFLNIYTYDYSGYFTDVKGYLYENGEKNRPQYISSFNIFSLPTYKTNYISERLTLSYALLNFFISLLTVKRNLFCRCHTYTSVQTSKCSTYLICRIF